MSTPEGTARLVSPNRRIAVLLSGGLDSAVLLAWLANQNFVVAPVFVDFGQGNRDLEREAALRVWEHVGRFAQVEAWLGLSEIDLSGWRKSVPKSMSMGSLPRNPLLILSVVPNARIFDCGWIAIGCTVDDRGAPDSDERLVDRVNDLLRTMEQPEKAVAPWLRKGWAKRDLARWALQTPGLGEEFVAMSHSCWKEVPGGCGVCRACTARTAALGFAKGITRAEGEHASR